MKSSPLLSLDPNNLTYLLGSMLEVKEEIALLMSCKTLYNSCYSKYPVRTLVKLSDIIRIVKCSWQPIHPSPCIKRIRIDDAIDFFEERWVTARAEEIIFGTHFNEILPCSIFPNTLKRLTFGREYNLPITPGVLPASLQELKFGLLFNQHLVMGSLPLSLKYLAFHDEYDEPIDDEVLPEGLIVLRFGQQFNQMIPKLPSTLKLLILDEDYHHMEIPEDVESIVTRRSEPEDESYESMIRKEYWDQVT
jgi:hypothetical protein